MEKLSDLYSVDDVLSKKKTELADGIDQTLERGNVSSDVLIMMKEMLDGIKPVTTMEDYIDDSE